MAEKPEKIAPGGQDQEQDEIVTTFGNTEIKQSKDIVIVRVLCKNHQGFRSSDGLSKPQSDWLPDQFPG